MIHTFFFCSGKEKNKTEIENKKFYGPAASCEELLKIGYTRNGFYLVKGNATLNNSRYLEIFDCLFKHPNRVKEGEQFNVTFRVI